MQFDEGVRGAIGGTWQRSAISDALEFSTEAGPIVDGFDIEGLLEGHATDVDEAAEHVGSEARALLVGEERDRDRMHRFDTGGVECLDDLETGEYPEVAVEAPPGADGVDM